MKDRDFVITMAQIAPVAGDIDGNVAKIISVIKQRRSADQRNLIVFPELSVPGYASLDLFLDPKFLLKQRHALETIAAECRNVIAIVGFADMVGDKRFNAAAILQSGEPLRYVHKKLLPNYDVFYESRYFDAGNMELSGVFDLWGKKVGVQICEDMWSQDYDDTHQVTALQKEAGAELIINISASPFYVGKFHDRFEVIKHHATTNRIPFVYVNMVGAHDGYKGELLFDGNSMAVNSLGNIVLRSFAWEEDCASTFVSLLENQFAQPIIPKDITPEEEIYDALVTGVREYFARCDFKIAIIGMSGGIDSALTAAIAAKALGGENVIGVTMPSEYSSEGSVEDSRWICNNLGMRFLEIPIEDAHDAVRSAVSPHWGNVHFGIAEENIQARIRGVMLMALSNKMGALVLSTGNKTETALGYCTLYGDTAGGLAVIGDLSKSMVYRISEFINERYGAEIIPRSVIEKPPSAELRPDQTDENSLGADYDVISPLVDDIIEHNLPVRTLQRKYANDIVARCVKLVASAEYKRRQMPPSIKVTSKAFGIGRRYPIKHEWYS